MRGTQFGQEEVVRVLLKHGANVNNRCQNHIAHHEAVSPLYVAAQVCVIFFFLEILNFFIFELFDINININ